MAKNTPIFFFFWNKLYETDIVWKRTENGTDAVVVVAVATQTYRKQFWCKILSQFGFFFPRLRVYYLVCVACSIHFNVILPFVESILSPLIHLIEFHYFFSHWLVLRCVGKTTNYATFNIKIFAIFIFPSWLFIGVHHFIFVVTFEWFLREYWNNLKCIDIKT